MEEFQTHTLPNGLRLIYRPTQSAVSYCGFTVNAGTRDEDEGYSGLAHFVEHTIFKGTTHRRASHILNRMEVVGGELNAYTSKEETVVYSVFPGAHLARAMQLLGDLVADSQFPERELCKEREVVVDEINSYRDTPSELIYDEFESSLFFGPEYFGRRGFFDSNHIGRRPSFPDGLLYARKYGILFYGFDIFQSGEGAGGALFRSFMPS